MPAAHLPTPEQKETTTSPGRSPERKVRCFKVREILQYSSPYIHPGQERPPWTGHYPKFLWRIGRLSKPEYTDYCNNLHALQKEYLRGKIELDDLQDGKQALMASITNRFFTSATHNDRSRKHLHSSSPPHIILELAQPSGPSRHRSAFKTGVYNKATNTKQHRQWRKEYRVVLRGSKMQ